MQPQPMMQPGMQPMMQPGMQPMVGAPMMAAPVLIGNMPLSDQESAVKTLMNEFCCCWQTIDWLCLSWTCTCEICYSCWWLSLMGFPTNTWLWLMLWYAATGTAIVKSFIMIWFGVEAFGMKAGDDKELRMSIAKKDDGKFPFASNVSRLFIAAILMLVGATLTTAFNLGYYCQMPFGGCAWFFFAPSTIGIGNCVQVILFFIIVLRANGLRGAFKNYMEAPSASDQMAAAAQQGAAMMQGQMAMQQQQMMGQQPMMPQPGMEQK